MDWEKKYSSAGMKLEIGSGEYPRATEYGFYHSDIRNPMPHQELCFSLLDLPFKDNSWDCIAIMHTLEHISWMKIQEVLIELKRVMKVGGLLSMVVPNLCWCAFELIKTTEINDDNIKDVETYMNDIYGLHIHPENNHLMGFTPEYMQYLLSKPGFSFVSVPRSRYNGNIEAWAIK